jgi:catechol 2,3-dioxygenase-like lactoylglutathione lyase family enzyme
LESLRNRAQHKELMKRTVLCLVALIASGAYAQAPGVSRPKITGIDHVAFYTTDADSNVALYRNVLGLVSTDPVEPGQTHIFVIGTQWVGYSPAPDPKATDRMDRIAFRTDDCDALRSYLAANGVRVPDACASLKNGSHSFVVKDPEGHKVEFAEPAKLSRVLGTTGNSVSRRIIHAGFIVRNREAEDHFYKDILGFPIYWHGGMQPDRTDWVAMQVPDGTDWLEYMLNVDARPSLQLTGVMNHISLGVADMKQAQAKLESRGWKPHGDEHAQMGKDGKWQLNLYDPDFTRIELMEFKPVQKPCCSDFTGAHPHEP